MGDNKFVCFFGVRDIGINLGGLTVGATATGGALTTFNTPKLIFLVKFNVGGSDKVIWDIGGLRAYGNAVAFTTSPVLIPQNTGFVIYYYCSEGAAVDVENYLQLIGVVVEPRGLTISP